MSFIIFAGVKIMNLNSFNNFLQSSDNIDTLFLNNIINSQQEAAVFLVSGVKLNGNILSYDDKCIFMIRKLTLNKDTDNNILMIYKKAICSITIEKNTNNEGFINIEEFKKSLKYNINSEKEFLEQIINTKSIPFLFLKQKGTRLDGRILKTSENYIYITKSHCDSIKDQYNLEDIMMVSKNVISSISIEIISNTQESNNIKINSSNDDSTSSNSSCIYL